MHLGIYMPRFPPSFLFDKHILRSYIIAHTAFDIPNRCVFCEVKQMEAKKGWSETKVVVRFWIISGLLAAVGLVLWFSNSMAAV